MPLIVLEVGYLKYFEVVLLLFIKRTLFAIYRVGRNSEAKDAARVALKSPWWTLGCKYEA